MIIQWILPILSVGGTIIGSIIGILVSQKLVTYRLEKLEQKVDKHNNLVERMAKVEVKIESVTKQLDGGRK